MPLSITEMSLFKNLSETLAASLTRTNYLNDVYEGVTRLKQLGLSIPQDLEQFAVWLQWPTTTVDSVEQRLDVTGFRMPGMAADKALWAIWQYNNMDERQTFAHTDALALERSYICVGTNEEDPEYPLITVETPQEMVAVRDPRTHAVTAALRMYNPVNGTPQDATLYLKNRTYWLKLINGVWVDVDADDHNLGTVPVVAMVNKNRSTRRKDTILEGTSEMSGVIPIAESASRALTNLQLAQETIAAPQRGVLGATKGDFVDQSGNTLSAWDAYFGSVWAMANKDAKTFQFDAAELSNWDSAMSVYARQASGITGLPVEYFGLNTENPPSADGQRAGETRLIKKAERRQTSFGHSWESVQRLVIRFRDGDWDDDARRMETIWRDPGTPTVAQVTDAVVKRYQVGLVDWETAQERLGESPAAIEQMKTRRAADSAAALGFGVQAANEDI